MNKDFGKPLNKTLARFMVGIIVLVWTPSVLYVAFAYDRPILKTVGMLILLGLAVFVLINSILMSRLNPPFRLTEDLFRVRDVGPAWKVKKYELRDVSEVRPYFLPFLGFKYKGKRVFLYVPRMRKRKRENLAHMLELAANKASTTDASRSGETSGKKQLWGSHILFAVNPIYLIVLLLAVLFVAYLKISNPYRELSTSEFWQGATVQTAIEIPHEALKPGNRNGPVLMWAAIGASDPEILKILVARGAQINEPDGIFKGTPLTGAAAYAVNLKMIDVLIDLGADVHQTVHGGETALMVAARFNENPGIILTLLKHGAILDKTNESGETALDIAKEYKNETAIMELEQSEHENK